MSVISPPEYPSLLGQVIFLAGPIQGALDWQSEAIRLVNDRTHVANPRRVFHEGTFDEQVDWETRWLKRAGRNGTILFWLANQATEHPERVYAQTTRFELGEWLARKALGGENALSKIVVGIDSKFQGARYIRHRIAENFPDVGVYDNLEATVEAAVPADGHGGESRYWEEFHRLWTSTGDNPGYDKSKWTALEKRLLATGRAGATENVHFVLDEARRLARR